MSTLATRYKAIFVWSILASPQPSCLRPPAGTNVPLSFERISACQGSILRLAGRLSFVTLVVLPLTSDQGPMYEQKGQCQEAQ
jgi:hypothetical protein